MARGRTRGRLALTALVALITVGALALLAGVLGGSDDERRESVHYGGPLRERVEIIAVVDGVEVTDVHWDAAMAWIELSDTVLTDELIANAEAAGREDFVSALEELYARYGSETRATAALLMNAVLLAEIERRDAGPDRGSVIEEVEETRRLHREFVTARDRGEERPDLELRFRFSPPNLENIDETVYWAVVAPEDVHRQRGEEQLRRAVMQRTIDESWTDGEARDAWWSYHTELLESAQITRLDGPLHALDMDEVRAYLEDYSRLLR